VWKLGVGAWDSEFRVWRGLSFGSRIWGLGFRNYGLGITVVVLENPEVGPAAVEVVLEFLVVEFRDSLLLVIPRRKLHYPLYIV
jgi:hypothetical protein